MSEKVIVLFALFGIGTFYIPLILYAIPNIQLLLDAKPLNSYVHMSTNDMRTNTFACNPMIVNDIIKWRGDSIIRQSLLSDGTNTIASVVVVDPYYACMNELSYSPKYNVVLIDKFSDTTASPGIRNYYSRRTTTENVHLIFIIGGLLGVNIIFPLYALCYFTYQAFVYCKKKFAKSNPIDVPPPYKT